MITDLIVYNLLKPYTFDQKTKGGAPYFVSTCQRELLVYAHDYGAPPPPLHSQEYRGVQAYGFLLRVACGLESQMSGETEVLGQIKEAWQNQQQAPQAAALKPTFQKLFEDVKDIRTKYLRHVGQASYGSLVRRMLSQSKLKRPVVVVGAGAFSESILPWLSSFEVWLANRTMAKAEALAHKLRGEEQQAGPFFENPIRLVTLDDAFAARAHYIFTVPGGGAGSSNSKHLAAKAAAALTLAPQGALVFDLGEPGLLQSGHSIMPAPEGVTVVSLQDLYEAQKKQASHTVLELERARRAATELAHQRSQSECMTFIHGWEDLFTAGSSV